MTRSSIVNAKKEAKKHREISIRNMYEFEGKKIYEIASELNITEREVLMTLKGYGVL